MYTSQSDKVLLGRGSVFFDRFTTAGVSTGLRYLGDASKLEISTADEKASIYDWSQPSAPLLNEVVAKREVTFAVTLHEYTKENVALVLMGDETSFTQTAGSVVDESVAVGVNLGRVYQTVGRRLTAITAKKSPSTALVLGIDYDIVDAELGLIHLREGAVSIAAGDTLLVSYTRTVINAPGIDRIRGANAPQILGKLVFVGAPAAGPAYDLEAWKLTISSEGVAGFITGNDFGAMELKGKVLVDTTNHPTEPYYRLTKRN